MKLQGKSCERIEKLASDSQLVINKYKVIVKNEIDTLNTAMREAEQRENQLQQCLSMCIERTEKWEEVLRQLAEEMSLFGDEVLQSADRQRRYQCLIESRKTKVEIAKRKVNNVEAAVQNGLVSAAELAKELEQDLNMSSERTRKLQQNIFQADNYWIWLDELKMACDNAGREQFQEIVIATGRLREQLQRHLQDEEELFDRLQKLHEATKLSKPMLEMASHSVKNLQEKIDGMSKGSNEIDQSCMDLENEKNLQKQLHEACDKHQRVKDETDLALSE